MKQLTTLILLLALLLSVLASCQGTVPTVSPSLPKTREKSTETVGDTVGFTKETDTWPTQEETTPLTQDKKPESIVPEFITIMNESEGSVDGKHIFMCSGFTYPLVDHFLTDEQIREYSEIFQYGAGNNHGAMVDYYMIDKADYVAAIDAMDLKRMVDYGYQSLEEYRFSAHGDIASLSDIWYSPDYDDHPWLIHPDFVAENQRLGRERKSVFHRYEPDTVHTNLYYTIDWQLIEAVGAEKFAAYETEFAGTENYNVLHFLSYFEIDKEEYLTLFPERIKPHNPDYIYGTKEMQDLYFCRHPMKTAAS